MAWVRERRGGGAPACLAGEVASGLPLGASESLKEEAAVTKGERVGKGQSARVSSI